MCGIIGIVGRRAVTERLMDGLRRLEYRGYDSAGLCTIVDGRLERRRAEGKLDNLQRELEAHPLPGNTGIAHTRWATHGAPTRDNAHPHATEDVEADALAVERSEQRGIAGWAKRFRERMTRKAAE